MRRMWMGLAAAALLGMPFTFVEAKEKPGPTFKNESWGYKLRVPKDWGEAAMSAKETWIASKHVRSRPLESRPDENGFIGSHTPTVWVIGFPHTRQGGAVREKDDEGFSRITIDMPYKDYKDFIKREKWAAGGGFYFSKEEETEVGGLHVKVYEIKVEKMVNAPIRLVTWVFCGNNVDFAVQFTLLEQYYDDYKNTLNTCLRSFREIPRTKALPGATVTGSKIATKKDESTMSPEERREYRKQEVERLIDVEIAGLPDDWMVMRSDHYCALSHADKKFTKRTLDHAEAIRGYLDKTFAGIGSDYVPTGVIRIFGNRAEENAFQRGTSSAWDDIEQVLVTKKHGEEKDWEYEYLSRRVTDQWLSFKNKNLDSGMPFWIREGLKRHMAFANPKGRRIDFKPDPYDADSLRQLVKGEKAIPLKELFEGDADKFRQHAHLLQAGSVVSWLLGEGNRGKVKNAVSVYLQSLIASIEEEDRKFEEKMEAQRKARKARLEGEGEEGDGGDGEEREGLSDEEAEKLEEEFDKAWEEYAAALKEKWKAIRAKSFEAAFGKLQDKDWRKLDEKWQKFAG